MTNKDTSIGNKKQVALYIGAEDLEALDEECKKFKDGTGKKLSRNRMIYYMMEQYFNNTIIKEDETKNGTGTIERDFSNGISTDEF